MLVESFHLILHVCILGLPILVDCLKELLCVDMFVKVHGLGHASLLLRLRLPASAEVDADGELGWVRL